MQQKERIMRPMFVCTLSKEEISDPFLVFDRLFRHNDLPGLRQINIGLLRSVMEGDTFITLTPGEQYTFIRFSSEIARTLEAVHILYSDRQDAPQNIVSEPDTPYGFKSYDCPVYQKINSITLKNLQQWKINQEN